MRGVRVRVGGAWGAGAVGGTNLSKLPAPDELECCEEAPVDEEGLEDGWHAAQRLGNDLTERVEVTRVLFCKPPTQQWSVQLRTAVSAEHS